MKKINELKAERAEIIEKMETISNGETLTEENRSEWTNLDAEIKRIDDEISMATRQDELNKIKLSQMETNLINEEKSLAVRFRDFLTDALETGKSATFRVNPMMSTSNSDVLNKSVAAVDVLTSPGEAFLRQLGVTMYTGLNGQLVLPSMDQETAAYVAEGTCNGDASMNITDIILAPRRITNYQDVTREFLQQTNPGIYQSLIDNLVTGIWNGVVNDFFDVVETDAATQVVTTGTTATYANILQMEASLGDYSLNPKYVTTPTGKAFFKGLDVGSDGIKYAWDGAEMNGYAAYGTPAANANKVYFGDWSKSVVGQWGGLEIIVDPYSYATCGKIRITALGLFDSGVANKRAFTILDASLA